MWNFTASLLQRFAGVGPLKTFLKYIFSRLSKDFLDRQPSIDFRSGTLQLEDLPLSASKINRSLLSASPYIMHCGSVKSLRVVLPSLSELSTKSIEVTASNILLVLKPNKEFQTRFEEKISEIKEDLKYYGEEQEVRLQDQTEGSMDFFKQLIKQVLTNIKVKVQNICVQIYMNAPSSDQKVKPQYYSMMRVPMLVFERFSDMEIGKSTQQFEKYRLEIPQVSTHLLREDTTLPQYTNVPCPKQNFPWIYPPVSHPSTILLLGSQNPAQLGTKISIIFRISKDVKHKIKQFSLKVQVPNIQCMIEGYQIQILLNFTRQLMEFKDLWRHVMQTSRRKDTQQSHINIEESRDFQLPPLLQQQSSKKVSRNSTTNLDLFTSVAFALEEEINSNGGQRKSLPIRKKAGYLDSIMLENSKEVESLKREVMGFNKEVSPEIKEKILQENKIQYLTVVTVKAEINIICLYLLKYNAFTATQYQRCWLQYKGPKKFCKINYLIPCSYFFLKLKAINIEIKGKQNTTIKLHKAKLYDIRLKDSSKPRQETMVFHSPLNRSTIFATFVDIPKQTQILRELVRFELQSDQHYCCNLILAVSQKPSKMFSKSSKCKIYNLLSTQKVEEPADSSLIIKITKEKKDLKIHASIKRLSLLLDLEVIKDLVNIAYPMFIYRHLVEAINLKCQQLNQQPKKNNLMSIYFSNYDYSTRTKQDDKHINHKNDSKKHFTIQLQSFKAAFRESPKQIFTDLIANQSRKTEDKQSFDDQCFCGFTGQAIGVQVEMLKSKMCGRSNNTSVGEIAVGVYTLGNDKLCRFNTLAIVSKKDNSLPQLFSEKVYTEGLKLKHFVGIYIPKIEVSLNRQQPFDLLKTIFNSLSSLDQLKQYTDELKNQMKKLSVQHAEKPKPIVDGKPPLIIITHIANANIYYMNFGAFVRHLVISHQSQKPIVIKGKQAIVISMETKRVKLKDAHPQKINESSYDQQGYNIERFNCFAKNIASDKIIMYMAKSEDLILKSTEVHDRNYFLQINKQKFPVEMVITKNVVKRPPPVNKATSLKHSSGFCFTKAKKSQIEIKDQDQHLHTILYIYDSATIRTCEAKGFIDVILDIKDIYDVVDKTRKKLRKQHLDRCMISHPTEEETKKLTFILKAFQLILDSFPYFEIGTTFDIMCNSRSSIALSEINFQMAKKQIVVDDNPRSADTVFVCNVKEINAYFLNFLDCHTENNPITLFRDQLIDYGFTKILFIKNLSFKLEIHKQDDKMKPPIDVQVGIDEVSFECSAKTTVYLQNHIMYLIKSLPKLKKNHPPAEEQKPNAPCMVEISSDCEFDDDEQAQELQTAVERKNKTRSQQQTQFRNSPMQPSPKRLLLNFPSISLLFTSIVIKRLTVTIYSGEDFSFLRIDPAQLHNMIQQPMAIELDNDNMVICTTKLDIKRMEDTRVRVRFQDPEKNTYVRVQAEMIEVEFAKQETRERVMIMQIRLGISSALCFLNRINENRFIIVRIPTKLLIGADRQNNKIKVKCTPLPRISLGFSSNIKFLTNQRKQAQQTIAKSFFAPKIAQKAQQNNTNETIYDAFVFIPQFTLILDLQLVGVSFINGQQIRVSQLFFHNIVSKYFQEDNKKIIKDWIKEVLTGNIGSVLGNSFVHLLTKGLWLMLGFLKQIVTLPGQLFRVIIR